MSALTTKPNQNRRSLENPKILTGENNMLLKTHESNREDQKEWKTIMKIKLNLKKLCRIVKAILRQKILLNAYIIKDKTIRRISHIFILRSRIRKITKMQSTEKNNIY